MQPKTTEQLRAIFGLGKNVGFDKEGLEALAFTMTEGQIERLSALSFDQANAMIRHLGGDPFPANGVQVPRRTLNHQKQKAGVVTMASPGHLKKMDDLAAKRGMGAEQLQRLCMRTIKSKRPTTAIGCSKVIEALKAMASRDNERRAA